MSACFVETERPQPRDHHILQIRLAHVDHVVNRVAFAEMRATGCGCGSIGRDPDFVAVGVSRQRPVVEVFAEQPELPELVSDVLADVSDGAVRAHDHFAVFVGFVFAAERRRRHHPAAAVLAFGFEVDRLALFQQFERRRPEFEMQNLALARQHVVLDVQPQHGGEVRVDDGVGHQMREFRQFARARFDGVQRFGAPGEGFRDDLCNAARCARKDPSRCNRTAASPVDQRGHIGGSFLFEEVEARHHVGHLHAGVVDVVLHFDAMAARAQHADESVAQNRVAQVADMRGFVRIDVGVLDDDLAAGIAARPLRRRGVEQRSGVSAAIEPHIDVAVARDFHGRHAGNFADGGDQFRGDLLRRLLQALRELKGDGNGDFAERRLARLFERERRSRRRTARADGPGMPPEFFSRL